MDTADYKFQGYVDDDARLIHSLLDDEWGDDVLKEKKILFFDETYDISSFNYNTGECAIKIYADEIEESPMGIGFDSLAEDRDIHIMVRTMDRDLYLGVLDEIHRIAIKYRLRPGNAWDTMWWVGYEPVYPTEKFYQGVITIHMKKYCHTLPISRENWMGDMYY